MGSNDSNNERPAPGSRIPADTILRQEIFERELDALLQLHRVHAYIFSATLGESKVERKSETQDSVMLEGHIGGVVGPAKIVLTLFLKLLDSLSAEARRTILFSALMRERARIQNSIENDESKSGIYSSLANILGMN